MTVMMVLLNVALMWAMALPTFFRIGFFLVATCYFLRIFLLATVFRGPFRVRALQRVR